MELRHFQAEKLDTLGRELRSATAEGFHAPQAVSLSAPTGSGKTVMATALVERILEGDETTPPDTQATFLWLTDQPELNEQTRRKMLAHSSVLGSGQLITIGNDFHEEKLQEGRVYFLNTQKLGRSSHLISYRDGRTFTIWDTIQNTIRDIGEHFVVILDEAHRGMTETAQDRERAETIVQKFLKGERGEISAVPVVLGITATPERFQRLVGSTERTLRKVVVSEEDVRESGLLKEVILLHHPFEEQPSDITMLRAAAERTEEYRGLWREYCESEEDEVVDPLLLVQVEDARGGTKQVTKSDLASAVVAVDDEFGPLPDEAYAHSFQEGKNVEVAGRTVRYLAPSDIQEDDGVKVVFFKTSLNTGWDCPRAEVMMSFRSAQDATSIAQLVGRMVRTPLMRRIDRNEILNSVSLYLPHYREDALTAVIERLNRSDPETIPPTTVRAAEDNVELWRRGGSTEEFAALEAMPSYAIPRRANQNQVRRLGKLARLLANDEIDRGAVQECRQLLLGTLEGKRNDLSGSAQFEEIIEGRGTLRLAAQEWSYGAGLRLSHEQEVVLSQENLDDLFGYAGRKLGEGLHKRYWRERVQREGVDSRQAKLEVFALVASEGVLDEVQRVTKEQVKAWLSGYRQAINRLPEGRRKAYDEVRELATEPELTSREYPNQIQAGRRGSHREGHLYVDARGLFACELTGWEERVLRTELTAQDVVGWLRNPPGKPWSICVPYRDHEGRWRGLYPDFIVLRRSGGGLITEILEPHTTSLADAPAKAVGLAEYARLHNDVVGRIEMMVVRGSAVRSLDMCDEDVRAKVLAVEGRGHLEQLLDG